MYTDSYNTMSFCRINIYTRKLPRKRHFYANTILTRKKVQSLTASCSGQGQQVSICYRNGPPRQNGFTWIEQANWIRNYFWSYLIVKPAIYLTQILGMPDLRIYLSRNPASGFTLIPTSPNYQNVWDGRNDISAVSDPPPYKGAS